MYYFYCNSFLAEVREQVYETLKKHCSGYDNPNALQPPYFSQSSANNGNIQQPRRDVPKSTNVSSSLQSQGINRPTETNIAGISGFSSPFNARRQQQHVPERNKDDANITNDAMALYARVDRSKKKKNRDSGGGSR